MLYYGQTPVDEPKRRGDVVDWSIAVKTGYWIAHCEIYDGEGMSVASRNGIGVNRYPLRTDGLVCVRRPIGVIDREASEKWFSDEARGQKYDFKGLMCFYLAVNHGSAHKMFCSEFALRWYRKACIQPLNTEIDADRTAPCEFWKTPAFFTVWLAPNWEP